MLIAMQLEFDSKSSSQRADDLKTEMFHVSFLSFSFFFLIINNIFILGYLNLLFSGNVFPIVIG